MIDIINDLRDKLHLQDNTKLKELKLKRTVKDSVFTHLFRDKNYVLMMYQALHPEDTATTVDDIKIMTLESHLVNQLYNDLGFMVDDRLIILVEHQSTWSENIVIRVFWYIADTWHKYVAQMGLDVYGSKKITLPKPELYVIYTGDEKVRKEKISLKDDIFNGEDIGMDIEVKVLYDGQEGDIIYQYVMFCKVLKEQIKIHGQTETAVRETIRICCDRNILKDYLEKQEKEIVNIMTSLFDEEVIMANHDASVERRGRDAGRAEGQKETTVSHIKNLMKSLQCGVDKAMDLLAVPQDQRTMYAELVNS